MVTPSPSGPPLSGTGKASSPVPAGPVLSAAAVARRVQAARARGASTATVLVLAGPLEGERRLVCVEPDGSESFAGPLDDGPVERAVDALLRRGVSGAGMFPGGGDAGTQELAIPGEATSLRVYLERTRPVPGLLIVGAGHIAEPLHLQGALLGYRVTVADDRPDFAEPLRFPRAMRVLRVDFSDPFRGIPRRDRTHVVLVTRGHRYDYECLRRLLEDPPLPVYIGMIGSRRRVRATFHQLLQEDIPRERLDRVHAPVGLDLGAETPAEIAVAVAAEWVMLTRGGSGAVLSRKERVLDRFFPETERPS